MFHTPSSLERRDRKHAAEITGTLRCRQRERERGGRIVAIWFPTITAREQIHSSLQRHLLALKLYDESRFQG